MFKMLSEVLLRSNYIERKETSIFYDDLKKSQEELAKTLNLNEELTKKFNNVLWLLENHYDEIYEDYCNSAICFGIKIGMEFQEFLQSI